MDDRVDGATILVDHLASHGIRAVRREEVESQIVGRGFVARPSVPGAAGDVGAALRERAFLRFIRPVATGAYADPDDALVANGREVGGMHLDDGHRDPEKDTLLDDHARLGEDPSVGAKSREAEKKLVGDGNAGGGSIVFRADEDVPGPTRRGHVVGERADRLANAILVGERFLALAGRRLQIAQENLERVIVHLLAEPTCAMTA
ncbi:MAG TPA: hypothetical protein VIY73_02605 [Polyangiaceae bacterium]